MEPLAEFLSQTVEGYLFSDLATMRNANGADDGACNYPLLATTFAGIELFGALLSADPFDRGAGRKYFEAHWRRIYSTPPRSDVGDALYQLARHGVLHAFVMKGDIRITKNRPDLHLHVTSGAVIVDAATLSTDLVASYQNAVKPSVGNQMATRLSEMRNAYATQWEQHAGPFTRLPPALNYKIGLTPMVGVSASASAPQPSGAAFAPSITVAQFSDSAMPGTLVNNLSPGKDKFR